LKFLTKFERSKDKLAPLSVFAQRMIAAVLTACVVIGVVLFIGVAGYHWLGGFDWVDSILEASMILGGMGPVNPLKGIAVKLFASAYALFSGLVFIGLMGIVLTPVVHRILHKFHVD
jgi:hypothetical protein